MSDAFGDKAVCAALYTLSGFKTKPVQILKLYLQILFYDFTQPLQTNPLNSTFR